MTDRKAKKPSSPVRSWMKTIHNASRVARMKPADHLVARLAAYLTLVGPPEDPEAQRAFWAIKGLFITQKRLHQWERALKKIPAEREAVMQVVECYQALAAAAGTRKWETAKFDLVQVVTVMLEIPNVQAYVRDAKHNDFLEPGSLFHPNSLAAARKRLRGALGTLSRDQGAHNSQIRKHVRVVRPATVSEGAP